MDFGALPPEINSARMYAGPGSGSLLAAAAGWDGLASDLYSTATSYQSVISSLTGESWLGPASESMAAAAAPFLAWLSATAVESEQVANQARAAASAYEGAFAMTVPPPVIAANRAQLMTLVATNLLGQNTAAIAANEALYGQMWAQDAAAMYGYAGNSAVAATLKPFPQPTQTSNPAGLAGQAAAVTQGAGTAAGSHTQTALSSLSTVPQTLQGLAQPVQSTSTASGLSQMVMSNGTSLASSGASNPTSVLSSLTGATGSSAVNGASTSLGAGAGVASGSSAGAGAGVASGTSVGTGVSLASSLAAAGSGESLGLLMDTVGLSEDGLGLVGLDGGGLGVDLIGMGADFTGADELTEAGGLGPLGFLPLEGGFAPPEGFGPLSAGLGGGVGASLGQAASLSELSVPQSWAEALPVAQMSSAAALPIPGTGFNAAPAVTAVGPSMPKMPFMGLSGREADGAIQRIGFRPTVLPHSPMAG